jgi:hypothetical protein
MAFLRAVPIRLRETTLVRTVFASKTEGHGLENATRAPLDHEPLVVFAA